MSDLVYLLMLKGSISTERQMAIAGLGVCCRTSGPGWSQVGSPAENCKKSDNLLSEMNVRP